MKKQQYGSSCTTATEIERSRELNRGREGTIREGMERERKRAKGRIHMVCSNSNLSFYLRAAWILEEFEKHQVAEDCP